MNTETNNPIDPKALQKAEDDIISGFAALRSGSTENVHLDLTKSKDTAGKWQASVSAFMSNGASLDATGDTVGLALFALHEKVFSELELRTNELCRATKAMTTPLPSPAESNAP